MTWLVEFFFLCVCDNETKILYEEKSCNCKLYKNCSNYYLLSNCEKGNHNSGLRDYKNIVWEPLLAVLTEKGEIKFYFYF